MIVVLTIINHLLRVYHQVKLWETCGYIIEVDNLDPRLVGYG